MGAIFDGTLPISGVLRPGCWCTKKAWASEAPPKKQLTFHSNPLRFLHYPLITSECHRRSGFCQKNGVLENLISFISHPSCGSRWDTQRHKFRAAAIRETSPVWGCEAHQNGNRQWNNMKRSNNSLAQQIFQISALALVLEEHSRALNTQVAHEHVASHLVILCLLITAHCISMTSEIRDICNKMTHNICLQWDVSRCS